MWLKIGVCILAVAIIVSGAVVLADREEAGMTWMQEDDRHTISMVDNVLDVHNVPTDFWYYESIIPLDTPIMEIVDVSAETKKAPGEKIVVGFSQMEVNNSWRIYENLSMLKAVEDYDMEMIYRDAESSLEKQLSDIRELIEENVDYLVVAPRQYYGYTEVLQEAKDAGIPVILLDRRTEGVAGVDYLTCIMCDFISIGRDAAELIYEQFGDEPITVLEVTGTANASVSMDLDKGFREVASEYGWSVIQVDGNFDQEGSLQPLEEAFITHGRSIDAVFTHIDDSALTAIKVMKFAGITPGSNIENGEVPIISMGGYKDGLKGIAAGKIHAIIECNPRLGSVVFHTIDKLASGEATRTRITIPSKLYTAANIEECIDVEGY